MFWGGFIGINFIIVGMITMNYFIQKNSAKAGFYVPILLKIYFVAQIILIFLKLFSKNK